MALKLEAVKKRDSVVQTMTLPTSTTQKQRYKRLQTELDRLGYESLHTLTRQRIDVLLDEVEAMISRVG